MTSATKADSEQLLSEPAADPNAAVVDAVAELISDLGTRIAAEMSRIQQDQGPKLQEALAAFRESVRQELAGKMRDEFETRFRESMDVSKRQFAQKLQEAAASVEQERNQMQEEISAARKRAMEISAELIGKQSELEHMNRETASMVEDPNIELSKIIRHNAVVSELAAYIRGLQFLANVPPKEKE